MKRIVKIMFVFYFTIALPLDLDSSISNNVAFSNDSLNNEVINKSQDFDLYINYNSKNDNEEDLVKEVSDKVEINIEETSKKKGCETIFIHKEDLVDDKINNDNEIQPSFTLNTKENEDNVTSIIEDYQKENVVNSSDKVEYNESNKIEINNETIANLKGDIVKIENNKNIVLIDKSKNSNCAYAIEYFYQDGSGRYYFTCVKSPSMFVQINNEEYGLVYALENGIITIKELEDNGYHFFKETFYSK